MKPARQFLGDHLDACLDAKAARPLGRDVRGLTAIEPVTEEVAQSLASSRLNLLTWKVTTNSCFPPSSDSKKRKSGRSSFPTGLPLVALDVLGRSERCSG
jgi:hypothetical protein